MVFLMWRTAWLNPVMHGLPIQILLQKNRMFNPNDELMATNGMDRSR